MILFFEVADRDERRRGDGIDALRGLEGPVALAVEQEEARVGGYGQIELAVAVEVRRRERARGRADLEFERVSDFCTSTCT